MSTVDMDELHPDKLRNEQIKMMMGPCMISFSIPLMVPGITITLVAFSDETGFTKYSALHVIGFIFWTVSVIMLVLGCVLKVVWKSKVTPDLERHLTPRNSSRKSNRNRRIDGKRLGNVMQTIYTGTCSTNLEEDSGRSLSIDNGITNEGFTSSSSGISESPIHSSSSGQTSSSSPSSSSVIVSQSPLHPVSSRLLHNENDGKVYQMNTIAPDNLQVHKSNKIISVKSFGDNHQSIDGKSDSDQSIDDKVFEMNKMAPDNLPDMLKLNKLSSVKSVDDSDMPFGGKNDGDQSISNKVYQNNEISPDEVPEVPKSSKLISLKSLDDRDQSTHIGHTVLNTDLDIYELPTVSPPSYNSVASGNKRKKAFKHHHFRAREIVPIVEDPHGDCDTYSPNDNVTALPVIQRDKFSRDTSHHMHCLDVEDTINTNRVVETEENKPHIQNNGVQIGLFLSTDSSKIQSGDSDINVLEESRGNQNRKHEEVSLSGSNGIFPKFEVLTHAHAQSHSETSSMTSGMSDDNVSQDSILAQYTRCTNNKGQS